MRWTLKLELTTDVGATHAQELGASTRSMNDVLPEEIDLRSRIEFRMPIYWQGKTEAYVHGRR
jgi:hypothetical protein